MKKYQKTSYVGLGIIFGFAIGSALGLVLFEQIALGGAFGTCIGIVIGAILDGNKKENPKLD